MEIALRNLIETNIPILKNEIYPTNAPEGHTKPYLVYARISTESNKTLEGYDSTGSISYMFSIMATKYAQMKELTNQVEGLLKCTLKTQIGKYYIEDLDINNVHEIYEHQLKVNRGIIDFTIYFKE